MLTACHCLHTRDVMPTTPCHPTSLVPPLQSIQEKRRRGGSKVPEDDEQDLIRQRYLHMVHQPSRPEESEINRCIVCSWTRAPSGVGPPYFQAMRDLVDPPSQSEHGQAWTLIPASLQVREGIGRSRLCAHGRAPAAPTKSATVS